MPIYPLYIYILYIYIYILYILYIYIYIRILYRYFLQFCSFPIAKMADKVCLPAVPPRLSPQLADGLSRRTSLGSCQTFPHRPRLRARALYCGLSGHLSSAVSNRSLYLAHSSYRCVCVCVVCLCACLQKPEKSIRDADADFDQTKLNSDFLPMEMNIINMLAWRSVAPRELVSTLNQAGLRHGWKLAQLTR